MITMNNSLVVKPFIRKVMNTRILTTWLVQWLLKRILKLVVVLWKLLVILTLDFHFNFIIHQWLAKPTLDQVNRINYIISFRLEYCLVHLVVSMIIHWLVTLIQNSIILVSLIQSREHVLEVINILKHLRMLTSNWNQIMNILFSMNISLNSCANILLVWIFWNQIILKSWWKKVALMKTSVC